MDWSLKFNKFDVRLAKSSLFISFCFNNQDIISFSGHFLDTLWLVRKNFASFIALSQFLIYCAALFITLCFCYFMSCNFDHDIHLTWSVPILYHKRQKSTLWVSGQRVALKIQSRVFCNRILTPYEGGDQAVCINFKFLSYVFKAKSFPKI